MGFKSNKICYCCYYEYRKSVDYPDLHNTHKVKREKHKNIMKFHDIPAGAQSIGNKLRWVIIIHDVMTQRKGVNLLYGEDRSHTTKTHHPPDQAFLFRRQLQYFQVHGPV